MKRFLQVKWLWPKDTSFLMFWISPHGSVVLRLIFLQIILTQPIPDRHVNRTYAFELAQVMACEITVSLIYIWLGLDGVTLGLGKHSFSYRLKDRFRKRMTFFPDKNAAPVAEFSPAGSKYHYFAYTGWILVTRCSIPVGLRRGVAPMAVTENRIPDRPIISTRMWMRTGADHRTGMGLLKAVHQHYVTSTRLIDDLHSNIDKLERLLKTDPSK